MREVPLQIQYKGETLTKQYKADYICYNNIIVELKALSSFEGVHEAQVLNYLKATGHQLGLLNALDRKSTRLNSSHVRISYAVFCLKKKITQKYEYIDYITSTLM